jgi:hypothetical protein
MRNNLAVMVGLMTLTIMGFAQQAASIDWIAVDDVMGVPGEMQEGDVHRFSLPRSDLEVTSTGVNIEPGFALGTWVAFKAAANGEDAVMMGDLVLTEDEYNVVIARLQESGIGQTAIHKHLAGESPRIWWTHIAGQGDPVDLARAVREALEQTGTPFEAPSGDEGPEDLGIDTAEIDDIIGHEGKAEGGVYRFSIPHAGTITALGIEVPPSMGTAIALNFQPTGDGQAAINGDFVMSPEEIDPVIQALREHDIDVVSLHNHMTMEEPRLFFLHFWQVGEPAELAQGLRAALDQVDIAGK